MRPSPPDAPASSPSAPGHVRVEAATAEEAIAEVHERLGDDAQIVQAEKVLRGGRWGFFQKQMVQLTARQAGATATGEEIRRTPSVGERLAAAQRDPAPELPRGLDAVLASLSAREDDQEEDLGSALRRHLGVQIEEDVVHDRPEATACDPAPVAPPAAVWPRPDTAARSHRIVPVAGGDPTSTPTGLAAALATLPPPEDVAEAPGAPEDGLPLEDVEFARASGTPWSGRGLLMLGLPRGFVDAVLAQEPADDAAWTYAVARTLAPLCRPLPAGPAAIVGPRAEKLARALGAPLVRLTGSPRGRSTFAAACSDSGRARTWLATHRGPRWTHLVVGGSEWRGLLFEGPLAVSWVGDDALGEAIRTAHDLGMVLGPGVRGDAAGTVVEPAPIELAMLLRDMLGGRR